MAPGAAAALSTRHACAIYTDPHAPMGVPPPAVVCTYHSPTRKSRQEDSAEWHRWPISRCWQAQVSWVMGTQQITGMSSGFP